MNDSGQKTVQKKSYKNDQTLGKYKRDCTQTTRNSNDIYKSASPEDVSANIYLPAGYKC